MCRRMDSSRSDLDGRCLEVEDYTGIVCQWQVPIFVSRPQCWGGVERGSVNVSSDLSLGLFKAPSTCFALIEVFARGVMVGSGRPRRVDNP